MEVVGDKAKQRGEKQARKLPRGVALHDDESVLMVASPSKGATFYKYVYTLGLYGLWRKRNTSVVTNRRILMGRGVVNREERSIPLSRVEGARFVRRGLHSYAELDISDRGRHHRELLGPLSPRMARRLTAEIQDHS